MAPRFIFKCIEADCDEILRLGKERDTLEEDTDIKAPFRCTSCKAEKGEFDPLRDWSRFYDEYEV